MNNLIIALDGAWKVLLAGLLLGAGIPSLFALAVNGLAMAEGGEATGGSAAKPAGKALAIALFALILIIVGYGLAWLIFTSLGFKVGFTGILPTFSK